MRKYSRGFRGILIVTLAASWGLLASCAKDKNLDDWKREKLEAELARFPSGTFNGAVVSQSGQAIGPISVELYPDTKITSSPGNYRPDEQAVLSGQVTFGNEVRTALAFTDGSYNSGSHMFKAMIPMDQRNGRRWMVSISGKVENNRIVGRVGIDGYRASSGQIELVKGASLPTEGALGLKVVTGAPGGASSMMDVYEGTTTFYDGQDRPAQLTILRSATMFEEQFLDNFLPVRPVQATISVQRASNSAISVLFADSEWDKGSGTLIGRSQIAHSDGTRNEATLTCREVRDAQATLECQYMTNLSSAALSMKLRPARAKRPKLE